jgi:hypothetical protein
MLEQIRHFHDSQKNERLNKAITRVAPKDKTFSKTCSLKDRVAFVMCVDSVGYKATMQRLLREIMMTISADKDPLPAIVCAWTERADKKKMYKREYDRRLDVKRKRDSNILQA